MKLSIVYNVCKNSNNLFKSLTSLSKIKGTNFEVIFVINMIDNKIAYEIKSKIDFKNIKTTYIFLHQNLGHSYAYNIGQRLATGEYTYFAGSKNIFSENFMEKLDEITNDKKYDVIILIDGSQIKFTKESYIKNKNTDLMNIRRKIINREFLNNNNIHFDNYKYYNHLYLFNLNEKIKNIGYMEKKTCDFQYIKKSNYNLYDILVCAEILFKKVASSNFNNDKKEYYNMTIIISILYEFIYKIIQNYDDKNVVETSIRNAYRVAEKIYPDFRENKFLISNRDKSISDFILNFKPNIKYCKKILEII